MSKKNLMPRGTELELKALRAFKEYFDDMYGQGYEIADFHMNGDTEPFDNFFASAMDEYNKVMEENDKILIDGYSLSQTIGLSFDEDALAEITHMRGFEGEVTLSGAGDPLLNHYEIIILDTLPEIFKEALVQENIALPVLKSSLTGGVVEAESIFGEPAQLWRLNPEKLMELVPEDVKIYEEEVGITSEIREQAQKAFEACKGEEREEPIKERLPERKKRKEADERDL